MNQPAAGRAGSRLMGKTAVTRAHPKITGTPPGKTRAGGRAGQRTPQLSWMFTIGLEAVFPEVS